MAAFWKRLRQEVCATVDDFREKGAIAVLKDAALDTRDIATNLGVELWDGVKVLISEPVLHVQSIPARGSVAPLEMPDGTIVQATVIEIDEVSEPPRAKVATPCLGEPLIVNLSLGTVPRSPSSQQQEQEPISADTQVDFAPGDSNFGEDAAAGGVSDLSLLDLLKQDCRDTVDQFREKGAVVTVRDAALDAANMVGSALGGVQSLASPLLEDAQLASSDGEPWASGIPENEAAVGARSDVNTVEAVQRDPSEGDESMEARDSTGIEGTSLLDLRLLDGLKQGYHDTVQDFHDKGAVGAVQDAVLDAADIFRGSAATAYDGACRVGSLLSAAAATADPPQGDVLATDGDSALPAKVEPPARTKEAEAGGGTAERNTRQGSDECSDHAKATVEVEELLD